jgi:hypothetical protein
MASRIIAFLITLLAKIIAGIAIVFVMLIAMNGYSESDASWGLGVFLICALLVTLLFSSAAMFSVGYLSARGFSAIAAFLFWACALSVVGVINQTVLAFIGIGIAEYMRRAY